MLEVNNPILDPVSDGHTRCYKAEMIVHCAGEMGKHSKEALAFEADICPPPVDGDGDGGGVREGPPRKPRQVVAACSWTQNRRDVINVIELLNSVDTGGDETAQTGHEIQMPLSPTEPGREQQMQVVCTSGVVNAALVTLVLLGV